MADEADRTWVDTMPEAYEKLLVPTVFRPFAIDLAARAATLQPGNVLELAAGTGVLAEEIARGVAGATVVATDLNAAMVEYGRRRIPGVEWRQADAMRLPFGEGTFDAVVCQFGVMFFPDKQVAFAETRRVLKSVGTFLFNTWAALETHDFQAALQAAVEAAFPQDPPMFMAAVPHGYADPDAVVADLRAAGFGSVRAESVTLEGSANSVAEVAAGYCTGTPLRLALEARGGLQEATALIAREMEARLGGGAVTGRMTANVFEATAGET